MLVAISLTWQSNSERVVPVGREGGYCRLPQQEGNTRKPEEESYGRYIYPFCCQKLHASVLAMHQFHA